MALSLVDRLSLEPGSIVHIRARILQDFGGDMQVEIEGPSTKTRLHISTRELIGCEKEFDSASTRA